MISRILVGLLLVGLVGAGYAQGTTNLSGLDLVWVGKGEFMKGAEADFKNPSRKTVIAEGYWISKYEITQEAYQQVMKVNPSTQKGVGHPVETVSWHEAMEYCRRLTEEVRGQKSLPEGLVFRLPTATEWEYAAKGGSFTNGHVYAGGSKLSDVGWGRDESPDGHRPVGLKRPNELGIHDLTGNVWEWCMDALPPGRTGKPNTETRIKRGGSYNNTGTTSFTSNIGELGPHEKGQRFGFRVVLAKPYVKP